MPTSDTIKFVREDRIVEVKKPDSNQTLLDFIRTNLNKKGSKSGCDEAGCGACLVVLGQLENDNIKYYAVNSCIFLLPALNGKQLIIVEDLANAKKKLHPVQDALIKYNAQQCGGCTSGFCMSLFAMFKSHSKFNDQVIKENLSSNLCRCCGYQTYFDAAKSLNNKKKIDHFSKNKKDTIKLLKKIQNESIIFYKGGKKYFAPRYVNELKKIIKKNPDATILSGGTDVGLTVTKERKDINSIIFINSVNELNYIRKNNKYIEIGATTPLSAISNFIGKYYKDFASVLDRYGSLAVRHQASIGGNLATASPIGDTSPLLLALDSKIVIEGRKKKVIPVNSFFLSYRKTKLKKDQFISKIIIPLFPKNFFFARKVSKRWDDDITTVLLAFNAETKGQLIKKIFIAYGGMDSKPRRAFKCEKILLNQPITEKIIDKAKESIREDFSPISDVRASKNYRMIVAQNLLEKAMIEMKQKQLVGLNA
tara:strand:- start:3100 stop:4539 length:1440 start_codon:yes stop_codon:yes gene_type:complete